PRARHKARSAGDVLHTDGRSPTRGELNADITGGAMPKQTLRPTNLSFQPRPEYPYSPGTKGGRLVYTAGQVAWNERAELVGIGDARAQTRQVLANVESILREGGATLADVLKC